MVISAQNQDDFDKTASFFNPFEKQYIHEAI